MTSTPAVPDQFASPNDNEGDPDMHGYSLTKQEWVGDLDPWRDSTYTGPDGHVLRVATPRRTLVDHFSDGSYATTYDVDEAGEQRLLASMIERHLHPDG